MAAPTPTPEELDQVFGGDAGAPPTDDMVPPEDEAADEEALDMAIDEAFDSEDPVARREAFKNAVRLCGHSSY